MPLYRAVWNPPLVEARQWTPDTDPEELADWCGGWTYTGTQHGHTSPPWQMHTCITTDPDFCGGKGHADPGDWIVRIQPDLFRVVTPEEFTQDYAPAEVI
jgi:hypothetical protein